MRDLTEFDFTTKIREYDYTKRAMLNMNRVMDTEAFREMDGEAIFNYLVNEMEIVNFSDHLKRYIFEAAGIPESFHSISDKDYIDIVMGSFAERGMSYSLTPTTRTPKSTVKSWIEKGQASRETVFILGFGLGMSDSDVSEFLMKVLKEEDFNFNNVQEAVFWSCLHKGSGYRKAQKLLEYYDQLPEDAPVNESLWDAMRSNPRVYLSSENNLKEYLQMMKSKGTNEQIEQIRNDEFQKLYSRVCDIVKNLYEDDEPMDIVRPADVERIICSGMPLTPNGNLQKISLSLLAKHFQNKRLTRQRIDGILKGKLAVDRFDLITLLFFIYAETVEPDWPEERTIRFMEEMNEILDRCEMSEIYPVNPYEAFVLMCMLTEYPLGAYTEVWEKSYETE